MKAILDAASKVFAAVGYESATTNAVARAASVPIGSLYQYFANKEALAAALADRHLRELRKLHKGFRVEAVEGLLLAEAVDRLLDPLIEFHVANPAFTKLMIGAEISASLARAVRAMDDELLERIRTLVRVYCPEILEDEATRASMVIRAAAKAQLHLLGAMKDPTTAAELARESKRMLVAYAEKLLTS